MAGSAARTRSPAIEVLTHQVERALRFGGDARVALALLVLAAIANLLAAAEASWRPLLVSPAYLAVVGLIVLSGIAGVAVRLPQAWKEWRRPSALTPGGDDRVASWSSDLPFTDAQRAAVVDQLGRAGYRTQLRSSSRRWIVAGTRRGWSRIAVLFAHLAVVGIIAGVALGSAFAEETRFGLFPGDQSLLAAPRPGLTSAVRFDRLDAAFDSAGNPVRFDTFVTFVRDGQPAGQKVLRVNEPGGIDGYLVHAWTYGPAVELRVEDLAQRALFDGDVALGGAPTGSRAPFVDLPSLGLTMGVALADAPANELRVTAADDDGVLDSIILRPGERRRMASTYVTLRRFTSYVTFVSRRDPGMGLVFGGAAALVVTFAIAAYLPRRRLTLAIEGRTASLRLRGERFDDLGGEFERLRRAVAEAADGVALEVQA